MVVLIVENELKDAQLLSSFLQSRGHLPITTDTVKSAAGMSRKELPGLVLLSLNGNAGQAMDFIDQTQSLDPQPPVIVMTRKPRLEDAVEAMRRGAHDFWVKPISTERLGKTMELFEPGILKGPGASAGSQPSPIITQDAQVMRIKAMAKRIAASNATVFIQGESGTGKELFARYIHVNSGRKEKPFVALNCAALPETLLESELFGHEKGAFTGAIKTKEGKFELADTGTLLLDEVTEIPVHLQAKLLRVLQESEVDRLGGRHPVPVDVRVIATTNLAMEESLKEGRFRKDLYYRLNVIPLKIPALRERPGDVALLSGHFAGKYSRLHGTREMDISPEALGKLQAHPWPGNVRELQNVIQRAVLLSNESRITPEHLIFDNEDTSPEQEEMSLMPLCEMEKRMIHKALSAVEGNRTKAAEILGISVRTLRNKLNEYRQGQGL
ncbi:MAG: sigma-54 dependent transcriptional regulator [Syntrophobacteraceae bacterium]